MEYVVLIKAVVEAPNEQSAARAALEMDGLLRNAMVKTLLMGRGVKLLGHEVDKTPRKKK